MTLWRSIWLTVTYPWRLRRAQRRIIKHQPGGPMIEFTRSDFPEEGPKDINVVTDDADAEMAKMADALGEDWPEDSPTKEALDACQRDGDGKFRFIITGAEAGEVAEAFEMEDLPELMSFLDSANAQMIEDAEAHNG